MRSSSLHAPTPVVLSELMLKARQPAVTRTCEFPAVVECECQVSRRMAFAAMRQRFREIGAPVPFRALRGVGRKAAIRIEQDRPEIHRPALVEWKHQRIGGSGRTHRRQTEQIGLDRQRVRIRHIGVGRKRHRRIKPRAVAAGAAMNRVEKILVAVIADAGFFVRRDVGRVQRAERKLEPETAGIFPAALRGVADHAIRRPRQIGAAFDKARLGERSRNAGGVGGLVIRQRHFRAIRERHRAGAADNPDPDRQRNDHDRDNAKENATGSGAHAFFPAIRDRSIGSLRSATPVAA